MKLTNDKIYQLASEAANGLDANTYIPARANFYIHKNIDILQAASQEIDKRRIDIAQHYGEMSSEGDRYIIPPEKMEEANQELIELFSIEQDLDIKTFSIEALGDTQMSAAQMSAIMFMIED